jgi:adenosylcobinamide-GDP ribazoletransferase
VPFWLALQFLTVLPTPRLPLASAAALGRSLSVFPVVGLVLGGVLAGLDYGLQLILPPPLPSALLVVVLAVVTGAHHLDGVADTFDGLAAAKSREERLRIMSEPGVGTLGVAGVGLVLLLKFAGLSAVGVWPVLLVMPVLGRWAAVWAVFAFPYARSAGMGLAYKEGVRWHDVVVASLVALPVAVLVLSWQGAVLMALLGLVMFGVAHCLRAKFGGLTGDTYGAIIELSEVVVLLLVAVGSKLLVWG